MVPFAAAAAAHVFVNLALMWGMLQLTKHDGRAPQPVQLESSLPLLLASDLGYASLGLVMAALWTVMGPFAAALVLVPLFVARWAMGQFAEQQRAYAATMAALCQAVETKDFYTRGHSERVSRGSGMIARQIGMRSDRVEAIMFAGMLHDVGKLGRAHQGAAEDRAADRGGVRRDPAAPDARPGDRPGDRLPQRGAGRASCTTTRGSTARGYPMGFAGDEIPEFARVIAVADAFDSMTSTRSYRGARRIDRGHRGAAQGRRDPVRPALVEAFIAALHRDGWRLPERADAPVDQQTVTAQDHDDPTAPLRVIESY